MSAGEPRCCLRCGRWGNRAFQQEYSPEGWVCTNDRACAARLRAAADPGTPS